MILNASNTYSGDTLINAGILYLTEPGDINAKPDDHHRHRRDTGRHWPRRPGIDLLSGGHALTGSGTFNGGFDQLAGEHCCAGNFDCDWHAHGEWQCHAWRHNQDEAGCNQRDQRYPDREWKFKLRWCIDCDKPDGIVRSRQQLPAFQWRHQWQFHEHRVAAAGLRLGLEHDRAVQRNLERQPGVDHYQLHSVGNDPDVSRSRWNSVWKFYVLCSSSTNVTKPLNQWTPLVTNAFDGDGAFNFTTNVTAGLSQQFYILSQ